MKKIIFIEPKASGFHIYSKWSLPRLGAVVLGTVLKELGHDVKVYVEEIRKIDKPDLYSADVVGISTITSTAPRAYEIADDLRERGIPVIFGGAHPTFLPDEALEHADYVVRGEGEEAIIELLDALDGNHSLASIAGLSYRENESVHHNPSREFCPDLDKHPSPDLSLIVGFGAGARSFFGYNPIIPVVTSRGCPFSCKFCSVTTMFGRKYRFRSADKVLEDLRPYTGRSISFTTTILPPTRNARKSCCAG